jgi:AcrR family transcriptional regulator
LKTGFRYPGRVAPRRTRLADPADERAAGTGLGTDDPGGGASADAATGLEGAASGVEGGAEGWERPPSHLGRPRAADRTPAILAAAKELVEEIGYDRLRIQDVADRAGVGLATVYRRWPTKQALVAETLRDKAQTAFPAELDDPVADLLCLYRALSDELCGQKGEGIPGFLVALRSEPELAQVFRQEVLGPLRDRARASLRRIVGPDCPQLELLVDLAPSLLTYRRIMLGEDIDTDAFLSGILSLVTSCAPASIVPAAASPQP